MCQLKDTLGEAGHAGNVETEGHRAFTFDKLVEEYDVVARFIGLVRHVIALHSREVSELIEQHVVVGREESHAV